MNTETSPTESKHPRMVTISLWISIWAVIISIGCLYIGFTAQSQVGHAERRLVRNVELLNESREQIEALDRKVQDELERSQQIVEELRFAISRNENRIRSNTQTLETTRKVASQLIDSLTEQREALEGYSSQLQQLALLVEGETPTPAATARTAPRAPGQQEVAEGTEVVEVAEQTESPPTEAEPVRQYEVRSGDTLSQIARRTGFSVPELLDANPEIDPNLIRVGQTLNLPQN